MHSKTIKFINAITSRNLPRPIMMVIFSNRGSFVVYLLFVGLTWYHSDITTDSGHFMSSSNRSRYLCTAESLLSE